MFVETFFITVCFSRGRIHLSHFAGGAGGVTLKAFEINPGSLLKDKWPGEVIDYVIHSVPIAA